MMQRIGVSGLLSGIGPVPAFAISPHAGKPTRTRRGLGTSAGTATTTPGASGCRTSGSGSGPARRDTESGRGTGAGTPAPTKARSASTTAPGMRSSRSPRVRLGRIPRKPTRPRRVSNMRSRSRSGDGTASQAGGVGGREVETAFLLGCSCSLRRLHRRASTRGSGKALVTGA